MRAIKVKKDDKIFVFKVQAISGHLNENFNPAPYRIIGLPSSATLYKLAEAITDSFDFYFDHPFGFYSDFKDPFHSKIGFELFTDIGEDSKYPGVEDIKILEVFSIIGTNMLFYFDYGDAWNFSLELIETREPREDRKYPLLIEKVGESPEQYPKMEEKDPTFEEDNRDE